MPKLAVPDDISKNRSMCSQESFRQRGGRGLRYNVKTMSNEIFFLANERIYKNNNIYKMR